MFSKLFGTESFMELLGTPSFWYTMVILIGIIVLLIACIKNWNKGGKFIILGLFVVIYTGLTIFSGLNINEYYSASGGIYGAITGIFDTNEVEVVSSMEFKLTNMELTQVGDTDTYSANIVMKDIFELDKDVEYMVFVNDMPCTFVENARDYVLADYRYAFYDENFEMCLEDTLNFRFAFYTNSTSFKVSTNGGSEALKYWHYYFNKNSFVVKIAEVKSLDDYFSAMSTGDISNFCLATYVVDDNVEYIQVYKKGSNIRLIDLNNLNYNTWTINSFKVPDDYIVNDDVTIVAGYLTEQDGKFRIEQYNYEDESILEYAFEFVYLNGLVSVEEVFDLNNLGSISICDKQEDCFYFVYTDTTLNESYFQHISIDWLSSRLMWSAKPIIPDGCAEKTYRLA